MKRKKILVVDDEPDIRELVGEILRDFDYDVTEVHDANAARNAVRLATFDAILLDIWMPGDDGITLLKEWFTAKMQTPVIMLSAHGSIQTAVEATRYGAYDYLEKPVSVGRLEVTVRNAVANQSQQTEVELKRPKLKAELVGSSTIMNSLRSSLRNIALTDATALIVGECGSGRRTAARLIHESSQDSTGRFVIVSWQHNEATVKSVTDWTNTAENGTLLIPDLDVLDWFGQSQTLNLLNYRDGLKSEGAQGIPRVVATASPGLAARVKSGSFNVDLYHRLQETTVKMPNLSDRPEDFSELVGFLTDLFSQTENLQYRRMSTSALNTLRHHKWSGNVTELKNVLRQALLSGSEETITSADIEPLLVEVEVPRETVPVPTAWIEPYLALPLREASDYFVREYLVHHIKQSSSYRDLENKTGLHRSTLFRKINQYGIDILPGGK